MSFGARFFARGIPRAQPRPRAFARTIAGRSVARVFDAGTAERWKADVVRAGESWRPAQPLEGPVRVAVDLELPRPKRLQRQKDPDGAVWAPAGGDVDNHAKSVLDAMTGDGWWLDDAQVVYLSVTKRYHGKSGAPGAWITVDAPP